MSALEALPPIESHEPSRPRDEIHIKEGAALLYFMGHNAMIDDNNRAAIVAGIVEYAQASGLSDAEIEQALVDNERNYEDEQS
jgi:hypothetical protein